MPIKYSLKDIPKYSDNYFSSHSLAVKTFEDHRAPDSVRYPFVKKGMYERVEMIMRDDEKWYVNTENNYKDGVSAPWITYMVTKHIKSSKLFKDAAVVSGGESIVQDYLLEGTIEKFDAFQKTSTAAKIGTHLGLIGALATLGVKSDYEAETILIDLKLTDQKKGQVIWSGKAEGKISGKAYADGFGWGVYERANESLKVAINRLTKELAEAGKTTTV